MPDIARKRLAGWLIRLAHRIYRPTVTETDWAEFTPGSGFRIGWGDQEPDDGHTSWYHLPAAYMPPERRESRGWN